MTAQEQAFRDYYGSMPDAELLRTAVHRDSYIELAQRLMVEEIGNRHLRMPEVASHSTEVSPPTLFERWVRRLAHRPH